MEHHVYIGYDARERRAWDVCHRSLLGHTDEAALGMHAISRHILGGRYDRPTSLVHGRLWDDISNAPMATDFSLARFWVPFIAPAAGWALYVDGDFLFRADVAHLFHQADPRFAVQVVKHNHQPRNHTKMDGQLQQRYTRKNWSSCMLFNLAHAGNRRLTLHDLNHMKGLDLHGFTWLADAEIGELTPEWNVLDGEPPTVNVPHCGDPAIDCAVEPKAYHYTRGTPDMLQDDFVPYEDEWTRWLTEAEIAAMMRQACKPASSATA